MNNIHMKRFVTACALGAAMMGAATAFAAGGVTAKAYVMLGPVGDIVYAGGTTVSNSEQYVVIFTADGYSFAGFTTDSSGQAVLADPQHSAVATFGVVSEIREGIKWTIGSEKQVKNGFLTPLGCSDGSFELYLLDTRTESGFAPVDKQGDNPTYLPTTINAWARATGSNDIKASALTYNKSSTTCGSITTTETTVIGAVTPVPVLVSMVCTNGVATVGATNTVATANYVLRGSLDLSFTNTTWNCESKKGAADAATEIYFSDADATNSAAFYRLEVVK